MKVVEHEPASWFLLSDKSDYYLEVSCTLVGCNFSLLIKLTADDRRHYKKMGKVFVQDLANEVQRLPHAFYNRNQSIELQKAVGEVILNWRTYNAWSEIPE